MFKPNPRTVRLALAALFSVCAACSGRAQLSSLKESDDQYIQGLRDMGMSELLERFVEADPPTDPIAKLALEIALNMFVSTEELKRANDFNIQKDFARANELFIQSRESYRKVLAAQRRLIVEHPDDERVPLWQTDYTEMLLFKYLPTYYQNVTWHYEFGEPTPEQAEAYESAMVDALYMMDEAVYRLDLLTNRVGGDAALRPKLEDMGIWYKLNDYMTINGPYWFAHAAHGVTLIPADHAYYKKENDRQTRNQQVDPEKERDRLRGKVVDALSGPLSKDERTKVTAQLLSGQTLVHSDNDRDVDLGVEEYLEAVIGNAAAADTHQGYIATMAKAVGRWNVGEINTAVEILGGMDKHPYVRNDPTIVSRMLAADLMFRILKSEAMKKPADQQKDALAKAYEQAYMAMIDDEQDTRFRNFLFQRWADSIGKNEDPSSLPPTVRMGIGEQLTQQGGGEAQLVVQTIMAGAPAIPEEQRQWKAEVDRMAAAAREKLERAMLFNSTLTGEDMEQGPLLARALFNLGMNHYNTAELDKALNGGNSGWRPYYEVARIWLSVAQRVPDSPKAEAALTYAMSLIFPIDNLLNKDGVGNAEVRAVYRGCFELLFEGWPRLAVVQNNIVYAGFHLYERSNDLEKAAKVYRALISDHPDYFQARRQMVSALHRSYRQMSDRLRVLEATQPPEIDPVGLDEQQKSDLAKARVAWQKEKGLIQENIVRVREGIVEDAELVIIDAKEAVQDADDVSRRFTAATALGAAQVVLAGMEGDAGQADKGLSILKGFEERFAPDSDFGRLAQIQNNPEIAKLNLSGIVQQAQQQRILILLDARRNAEMTQEAKKMMDSSPAVAANVVNGVLNRIGQMIEREERAERDAAFERQRQDAKENIRFLASAAVDLGELLVEWALGQGFDEQKMVAYRLPLAESLMLAGRSTDALDILKPIFEANENNFRVRMMTGKAYLSAYKQVKNVDNYNNSHDAFARIITYYNQRPEKPDLYWEAWLNICRLKDAADEKVSKDIPKHARMLIRVDPDLGGVNYKDKFMDIFNRHGGVEVLEIPQE